MASDWQSQFEQISQSECVSGNDIASRSGGCANPCGCAKGRSGEKTCRDHRCINYSTQTECVTCSSSCVNNRFQNACWRRVAVRHCEGKGFGLFAEEGIPVSAFVAEFTGEIISRDDLSERMRSLVEQNCSPHQYMIQLKAKTFIDCSRKGSIARFINHSCEPNCRLEVWTVRNRLRVGVFSMAAVACGEELTFDYQWEPSGMPPTKCCCGKPSCRGYLEVFRSDNERAAFVGAGQWVNSRDCLPSAADQLASHLPGKRIKIWDDNGMGYIESKVLEYAGPNDEFSVFVLDGSTSTEVLRLSPTVGNWYWFDDTKSIISIKKKENELVSEGDATDDESTDAPSIPLPSTGSDQQASIKVRQSVEQLSPCKVNRETLRIKGIVAQHLLGEECSTSLSSALTSTADATRLSNSLLKHLFAEYELRAKLFRIDQCDGDNLFSFDVEVCGEKFQIQTLRRMMKVVHERCKDAWRNSSDQALHRLERRQSVIFTHDWRMLPMSDIALTAAAQPSFAAMNHACMPCGKMNRCLEMSLLPTITKGNGRAKLSAPDSSAQQMSSKSAEHNLLLNLKSIVSRLNFPRSVSLCGMALLLRYVRLIEDTLLAKDTTIVLAAIVLLALKSKNLFKFKLSVKVICAAYCQVFSRMENEVTGLDSYLPKVFEKEREVYAALHFDAFVPSVHVKLLAIASFENLSATSSPLFNALKEVGESSDILLELILINNSSTGVAFMWDVLQIACLLCVFGLECHFNYLETPPLLSRIIASCSQAHDITGATAIWTLIHVVQVIQSDICCYKCSGLDVDCLNGEGDEVESAISGWAHKVFAECTVELARNTMNCLGSLGSVKPSSSTAPHHRLPDSSNNEDYPIKTRLHPSLLSSSPNTTLNVRADTTLKIGHDTFQALSDFATLNAAHVDFLLEQGCLVARGRFGEVPITLRAVPLATVKSKEMHKARSMNMGNIAVLPQELYELNLIQQVHYVINNAAGDVHPGVQHIVQPFKLAVIGEGATTAEELGNKHSQEILSTRLLAIPPVFFTLSSLVDSGERLPCGDLAVQWCRQLFLAVDHMLSSGVLLKWIGPEHIFITIGGQLVIGSLAGAVFIEWETPTTSNSDHKAKKSHRSTENDCDEIPKIVPHSYLHLVAPEVILGGDAHASSAAYCAGTIACLILTGQTMIKNGRTERKQLDFVFRALGTPKAMDYLEFDLLPHSNKCNRLLQKDDGSFTESRSRLFKVVKSICPKDMLAASSEVDLSDNLAKKSSSKRDKRAGETDGGGPIDVILACCALVPRSRSLPAQVLKLRILEEHSSGMSPQVLSREMHALVSKLRQLQPQPQECQARDELLIGDEIATEAAVDNAHSLVAVPVERDGMSAEKGTVVVAPGTEAGELDRDIEMVDRGRVEVDLTAAGRCIDKTTAGGTAELGRSKGSSYSDNDKQHLSQHREHDRYGHHRHHYRDREDSTDRRGRRSRSRDHTRYSHRSSRGHQRSRSPSRDSRDRHKRSRRSRSR